MIKRSKFFQVSFRPGLQEAEALQAKADEIMGDGYHIDEFQITGPGQALLMASKYYQTMDAVRADEEPPAAEPKDDVASLADISSALGKSAEALEPEQPKKKRSRKGGKNGG